MTNSKNPGRAAVEAAIRAHNGNLSKAAGTLRCGRPTLYRWIWNNGLSALAGLSAGDIGASNATVNVDGVTPVNHDSTREDAWKSVTPFTPRQPILPMNMETQIQDAATREPRLNRSVGLTDSTWKAARVLAIEQGRSAGDLVEEAIQRYIATTAAKKRASGESE